MRRGCATSGHSNRGSALKLLYMRVEPDGNWKMPPREWGMAKVQFAILFEDRFTWAG